MEPVLAFVGDCSDTPSLGKRRNRATLAREGIWPRQYLHLIRHRLADRQLGWLALLFLLISKSRRPYAPEFRRQMVDPVQSGRTPEALLREFAPTAQAIWNWLRKAYQRRIVPDPVYRAT